jgi:mono/diheme cytochrome c family protein
MQRTPRLLIAAALLAALAATTGWLVLRSTSPDPAITRTSRAAGLELTLALDGEEVGERSLVLTVRDEAGGTADVDAARLRFTMTGMDMGLIETEMRPLGGGRFEARGSFFSMAGRWIVQASILKDGQAVASAPFDLTVAAPGELAGPINPFEGDAAAVAMGRELYVASCASCHGDAGRGDGPSAVGLSRGPADLTQHLQPGLHTDGQIFAWIKDGYPGTAMPAFGGTLSDEQIWQIVTYLRTLAQQPAVASAYPEPAGPEQAYPQPNAPAQAPPAEAANPPLVPDAPEPLPPLIFTRAGDLWRSEGDGSPPRLLFDPGEDAYVQHPALSPDGGQLVYVVVTLPPITDVMPPPTTALFVANADGSQARAVWQPPAGTIQMPSWAADGGALVLGFTGAGDGSPALQVLRLDLASGERTELLSSALDPALSPDGRQLAFLRVQPDGYTMSLALAAPDGSGERTLLEGGAFQGFYAPRFAPDGSRIIVAAVGGPETDEQGVPITGSSGGPLEALARLFEPPAASAHGLPWDLWEVRLADGNLRRLTSFYADLPMVAFSPDGAQVAILAEDGFYLMDGDGANLRRIDPLGDHGGVTWLRRN